MDGNNPNVHQQMDKENVVYIYHGILLNFKKEGNLDILTTWVSLENVMLSETSQSQKDKCYKIPLI